VWFRHDVAWHGWCSRPRVHSMSGPTSALLVWVLLGLGYVAAVWRLAHQGDDGAPSARGQMSPSVATVPGRRVIGVVSSATVGPAGATRTIPHAALVETPALALAPERGRVDAKARGRFLERRALR